MCTESVVYETVKCSLGILLVAMTIDGIAHVSIGGSYPEVGDDFRSRHNGIRVVQHDISNATERIRQAIDDGVTYSPTLDITGTPFQLSVWSEIKNIPRSTVVTYAQLARNIGKPRSVRAVANACGVNPVAILVPCHRVVGTHRLGGYRWGQHIKRKLLESEGFHVGALDPHST